MALILRDDAAPWWVTDEDVAAASKDGDIMPDSDVAYLVRECQEAEQRELRADLVQMMFDRKSHQKVERPLTNEEQTEFAQRIFCRVLVDWRGIVDAQGQPIPCDDTAKRALWRADKPRVLALFRIVNTLQVADAERRGKDSFRPTGAVGAVVG